MPAQKRSECMSRLFMRELATEVAPLIGWKKIFKTASAVGSRVAFSERRDAEIVLKIISLDDAKTIKTFHLAKKSSFF